MLNMGSVPYGAAHNVANIWAHASRRSARLCVDSASSPDGLVKGVSFRMRSGEVVAIHGDDANALRAIADICLGAPLSQGSIRVKGSLHALTGSSWSAFEDVIVVTDASRTALHELATTLCAETLAGLAGAGAATLVLSRDFHTLAACADRLLVMRDGRLTEELSRYECSCRSASESLF
jgi:ABC-type sugar transport system ATPase subunit